MPTATKTRKAEPRPSAAPAAVPTREQVDFLYYSKQFLCTEKGERLDFAGRPYLKDIYDCPAMQIAITKSTQVGMSGFGVNKSLWLGDNFRLTGIYVLPTREEVGTFSQTRFNPIAKSSRIQSRMEVDNVGIKQIGDSFIHFRGTWKETEAQAVPADFVFIDELDKCKQDTAASYKERLTASKLGMELWLSTPTYENYGIDLKWKESDQREWHVRCPGCSFEQILSEDHIDYEADAYRCEKCKAFMSNSLGRWIATAKGRIAGFHPTQLIAPWIQPRTIIDKRNDPTMTKKDFTNYVLGRTYQGGTTKVTRADIIACLQDNVATNGTPCIGVDWGNTSWFVVRKPGRIVHYGKIEGDTRTHPRQVLELADKFPGAWIIADHGYGDTKNIGLIENRPRNTVWMCVYAHDGRDMKPRYVEKDNTVHIDRTTSLTLRVEDIQNRRVQIAHNDRAMQETLIEHYKNLYEKKEQGKDGVIHTTIERSGPDHLAHADNYASLLELKKGATEPSMFLV